VSRIGKCFSRKFRFFLFGGEFPLSNRRTWSSATHLCNWRRGNRRRQISPPHERVSGARREFGDGYSEAEASPLKVASNKYGEDDRVEKPPAGVDRVRTGGGATLPRRALGKQFLSISCRRKPWAVSRRKPVSLIAPEIGVRRLPDLIATWNGLKARPLSVGLFRGSRSRGAWRRAR
jgi:hypothetical protein